MMRAALGRPGSIRRWLLGSLVFVFFCGLLFVRIEFLGRIAVFIFAADAAGGPLLELGCGSGRLLLSLAQAGHDVTGLDLAAHMLKRAREKTQAEPAEVRDRVTLLEGDMTSFRLERRFTQISCAFGTFHHLDTVDRQLACLRSCRNHPAGHVSITKEHGMPSMIAAARVITHVLPRTPRQRCVLAA